jgi:UDP-N-acetyl-D-galactosamine dehydrogenase
MNLDSENCRIAVIGLGYVGLPLLVAFARKFDCVGFDINLSRINELKSGRDATNELTESDLDSVSLSFTSNSTDIQDCNVYIVTVPTPIDAQKRPDLGPLRRASSTVGPLLSAGDVVVFESTVYPGATEEVCVPILEETSGLKFNRDFFAGYSPERINPGDKVHRIESIVKVTSGSTPQASRFVDELYGSIVTAGTHPASSIRVAEAAKVIENTQRDLNIALINELAIIFEKLGLDTEEVLLAAGTKWNFLPFRPGLVGGHCISVDPYYLTHKSQEIGYHPNIILAGRRINDGMGSYIADRVIKSMTRSNIHVVGARVLIMGLSFKENCPDLRNTRVVDVVNSLEGYNAAVDIYDPWANSEEAFEEYKLTLTSEPEGGTYDAVILAVSHDCFKELGIEKIRSFGKEECILFDVKYALPAHSDVQRL